MTTSSSSPNAARITRVHKGAPIKAPWTKPRARTTKALTQACEEGVLLQRSKDTSRRSQASRRKMNIVLYKARRGSANILEAPQATNIHRPDEEPVQSTDDSTQSFEDQIQNYRRIHRTIQQAVQRIIPGRRYNRFMESILNPNEQRSIAKPQGVWTLIGWTTLNNNRRKAGGALLRQTRVLPKA